MGGLHNNSHGKTLQPWPSMGGGSKSELHNRSTLPGLKRGYEEDLNKNLDSRSGSFLLFKVPQTVIDTIRSKLTMKFYDEYTNVLKRMYSADSTGEHSAKTRWLLGGTNSSRLSVQKKHRQPALTNG